MRMQASHNPRQYTQYALSAESDSDLDEHHDMEDLDDDDDDSDVPPTPKRQRTGDKHRGGHRGGQKKAAPRGVSSAGITDPSVPTSGDEKKRRKQHNPWYFVVVVWGGLGLVCTMMQ